MRPTSAVFPALLFAAIALMLTTPVFAQAGEDEMAIEGRMLISGLTALEGSATVKVTYAGDAASLLREEIFSEFDTSVDMSLSAEETRSFLVAVCDALVGKIVWGIGIESATNFTDRPESYLLDHTSGLVGSGWDSTDPIAFTIGFEGSGSMTAREVEVGQGLYESLSVAVAAATGYYHEGSCAIKLRVTTFVIGSFSDPNLSEGEMNGARTPFGDVLWYSFSGDVGPTDRIEDKMTYRSFSLMDNQQISLIIVLVGAILILRMPGRNFDKFEKLHPKKFRKYAKPLLSVRLTAIAFAAVAVVLYAAPFLFKFASPNTYFAAGYLFVVVPVMVVAEHFLAKMLYGRAVLTIPDESTIEIKQAVIEPEEAEGEWLCKKCYMPIEETLDIFQCSCGTTMHIRCAEKAQTCPQCGAALFPQHTRSIQCRSCGEAFLYSGSEDAYSVQCTKCGAFQEEIAPGKNYLVVDRDPHNAFLMIRAISRSNRAAMCLTTQFPGKVRSDYDMGNVSIKWFSDSTTDIDNVNPNDVDGDPMEIISTFLMTTRGSGVLIEGIDNLIELNGFEKVLNFIKKVNDLASTHGSTIILALDKNRVTEAQYKVISEQFDETHDYS